MAARAPHPTLHRRRWQQRAGSLKEWRGAGPEGSGHHRTTLSELDALLLQQPPPVLRERGYCKLNERLHHCLSEAFQSEDEVKASAHADWLHDLDHVPLETDLEPETLDFDSFLRSLWEVADVWTDEIDEEMYAAILWKLLDEVIVGKVREVDRVYKWHGDKNCAAKIKCIARVDPNSYLMEARERARASARPRATP